MQSQLEASQAEVEEMGQRVANLEEMVRERLQSTMIPQAVPHSMRICAHSWLGACNWRSLSLTTWTHSSLRYN